MVKPLILILLAVFFCAATAPVALAQVAVEYGIIGSKPPPISPDIAGKVETRVQTDSRRVTCSSNACRSKQTDKSTTVGKVKEPRGIEKRGAHKGTGPLIIEQRGDHYERIN